MSASSGGRRATSRPVFRVITKEVGCNRVLIPLTLHVSAWSPSVDTTSPLRDSCDVEESLDPPQSKQMGDGVVELDGCPGGAEPVEVGNLIKYRGAPVTAVVVVGAPEYIGVRTKSCGEGEVLEDMLKPGPRGAITADKKCS